MVFVNPIELLQLDHSIPTDIDISVIKKARRKIQAEIEFSDEGSINYKGLSLNKSEIDEAINKLENHENIDYFHFIANTPELNNFLVAGETGFFDSFRQESIYKIPSFINLISPFFSYQYDLALLKAFQSNNSDQLKKIISFSPLVNVSDRDTAYKSLSNLIRQKIKEIDLLTNQVENEESRYDENTVSQVVGWTRNKLSSSIINMLPNNFQSLRNQAAKSIRNLSVSIFNTLDNSKVSLFLIEYALSLDIDGITKENLQKDRIQIKQIDNDRSEREIFEPVLKKYAALFTALKTKIEGVGNRSISASAAYHWVNSNLNVTELNSLDQIFAEVRNQLALGLRALSVAIYNNYDDPNISYQIILKSDLIKVGTETKAVILAAKEKITLLKRAADLAKAPTIAPTPPPSVTSVAPSTANSREDYSGLLLFVLVVVVIIIVVALSNCKKNEDNYSSYSAYTTSPAYTPSSTYAPTPDNSYSSTDGSTSLPEPVPTPAPKESVYRGNQLSNGSSPFNSCFGAGDFEGEAYITFKNSNASDAIICLVNVMSNKTIRNEYVQAGSNFTMKNIPSGTYFLKVLYGNDWNPNLTNFCGTSGNFETDVHFSKSDNYDDYIRIENDIDHYTTGEITLYTVTNGNMRQQSMSESDFFK